VETESQQAPNLPTYF